ncbi:MAG: conjugal transfer protein TraF [Gammaproteobacteria bacterium]|nr:conjugal transfer protein TraF [Gammaproteobacteria bacterium]
MQRKAILIIIVTSFLCSPVSATPFLTYDARSLGMGSIGVASGKRYGQFNNPALLPFDIEFVSWYLLLSDGRSETDPDGFVKELRDFQFAASSLASSPTVANANVAQSELQELVNKKFDQIELKSLAVSIPSKVLGGAVFINKYVVKTMRATVGAIDVSVLATPAFNSTLEKVGLSVIEQGVSFARVINEEGRGFNSWALGFSPKFMFAKTSSVSGEIQNTDTNISFKDGKSSSAFNIDIGVIKELGRYRFGAVIKNLIPMEFDLPGGDEIKVKPQLRVGLANEKRKNSWEINLDLTPNDGVIFTNETAYLSMGTEFKLTSFFRIRAGYRQNLLEDNDATISVGLGIGADYQLEAAVFKGDEEQGAIGQFGINF